MVEAGACAGLNPAVGWPRVSHVIPEAWGRREPAPSPLSPGRRWELNVGVSIVERVQSELERASAVIAVLSPSSIGSRWVQRELQSVVYREVADNRTLILPVLIEDCTIPAFLVEKKVC